MSIGKLVVMDIYLNCWAVQWVALNRQIALGAELSLYPLKVLFAYLSMLAAQFPHQCQPLNHPQYCSVKDIR
ncbi:hypothetical protein A6770_25915 [Nostoc minutum NIES-26]|uniref:Uncharacterized protein n=1 Tax=Nostoc minutum NIES-26 TaxID=1844469 RepID=A0A367QSQ3_9NOSO|nr:hypothetical protein A6770_25915 [Nostoc minutum NIES-26]